MVVVEFVIKNGPTFGNFLKESIFLESIWIGRDSYSYIPSALEQELRLQNEYLLAENRILRSQIQGQLQLMDEERKTLAQTGKQLGRKGFAEIAMVARPDTILGWNRKFIKEASDESENKRKSGRPRVHLELEFLIVRMVRENKRWGDDRIVGALANGLYALARKGLISNFTGITDPYVPPLSPEVKLQCFTRSHFRISRYKIIQPVTHKKSLFAIVVIIYSEKFTST